MQDTIAVLIPCYNEAVTIGKVVDDFKRVLPEADIYALRQQLFRRHGQYRPSIAVRYRAP